MSYEKDTSIAKAAPNPNPTPANNPKLREICNQLDEIGKELAAEMSDAMIDGDFKRLAELSLIDDRLSEVQRKIGCSGVAIVSTLDQILVKEMSAMK